MNYEVAAKYTISSMALDIKLFLFQAVPKPCEQTFRVINVCYLELKLQIVRLRNIAHIMGEQNCDLLGAEDVLADQTLPFIAREELVEVV